MDAATIEQAILTILAPATRDRYDYTGTGRTKTAVNPTGIDLHVGKVGQVATAPDGTAAPYGVLYMIAPVERHGRLPGGASQVTAGFQLTLAAGSRQGVTWALGKVKPLLARARLTPRGGLLTPYFDEVTITPDEDASPTRWSVPLRYTASVH